MAREYLEALHQSPLPKRIWSRDFLNYYHFPVPQAAVQDPDAPLVSVEIQNFKGLIDVAVVVYAPPQSSRPPITLSIVVDTSASMTGAGISRARAVVSALASHLLAGDRVQLLTTRQALLGEPALSFDMTSPDAQAALAKAAASLEVESEVESGAPYLYGAAYDLAERNLDPNVQNRAMVVSDGVGSVFDLDAVYMQNAVKRGIRLVALGVGQSDDDLLRTAARLGGGRYAYVDSLAEADILMGQRFDELTDVSFESISLELQYPDSLRRLNGQETSVDPVSVEPQSLAPGSSMVLSSRFIACGGAVFPADSISAIVSYTKNGTSSESTTSRTFSDAEAAGPSKLFQKILGVQSYADALASLDGHRLDTALGAIDSACTLAGGSDPELGEIEALILAHPVFLTTPPASPSSCLAP